MLRKIASFIAVGIVIFVTYAIWLPALIIGAIVLIIILLIIGFFQFLFGRG
jgi:hypothetical protein